MSELALLLAVALAVDALIGDPEWLWSRLPHPAVQVGRAIGWADARFNIGGAKRSKGALLVLALVSATLAVGAVLSSLGDIVSVAVAAILLAQRSLTDHVRDVANALRSGLEMGRKSVSKIVGRETAELDQSGVARGAIESAAENFSIVTLPVSGSTSTSQA